MPLQPNLIKPCSKALHVIQRGRGPRMSERVERYHTQALWARKLFHQGSKKVLLLSNIRVSIHLRSVVCGTLLSQIPRHMARSTGTQPTALLFLHRA